MMGMRGAGRIAGAGAGALALALALTGCDDEPERLEGGLVLGTVDAFRLCDVNATELRVVAQWLACPPQQPDCEPPEATEVKGDRFSCPSAGPTVALGVEPTSPGRYQVEVRSVNVSGPDERECFVDPDTGEAFVDLPAERLFEGSPVGLDEHGACP